MIARDEGGIDRSHRLRACIGFEPLNDHTRSPPCGPTVVGGGVQEQPAHVGVSFLIRGSVTQPTERQCKVRGVFMHCLEQFADKLEIAFFIARESDLSLMPASQCS